MVRDERGAGFMADGYARITNHIGVCLVTAGPGSTNLTTPMANAYKDNSSVLAITGRCAKKYIGKNYFQEMDIGFLNFYKGYVVDKADIRYFDRAFNDCIVNKKPVQINISADTYKEEVKDINADAYTDICRENIDGIEIDAKKPLFLIGQGIFGTLNYNEMLKISDNLNKIEVPIATTFPARGVIDERFDNCVGLVGRRGDIKSLLEADRIINIGSSLSYNTYMESVREKLLSKTENIQLKPKSIKELKEFLDKEQDDIRIYTVKKSGLKAGIAVDLTQPFILI